MLILGIQELLGLVQICLAALAGTDSQAVYR